MDPLPARCPGAPRCCPRPQGRASPWGPQFPAFSWATRAPRSPPKRWLDAEFETAMTCLALIGADQLARRVEYLQISFFCARIICRRWLLEHQFTDWRLRASSRRRTGSACAGQPSVPYP
eukprot:7384590-Prymnesium_polylepis.1